MNDISKAIESEKKQKQREKEKKELEKVRQFKIKRQLIKYFENQYKKSSNYEKTTYFLIQNKQLIIDIIKSEYIKQYEIKSLDFNTSIFLNDEYIKILNAVKRPYYEMIKIKKKEEQEILKQQKEAEKMQKEIDTQQEIKNINQYKILETFLIILLLPLILILGIIKGLLKK